MIGAESSSLPRRHMVEPEQPMTDEPTPPATGPSDLQFERAETVQPTGAAAACAACKNPLAGSYYTLRGARMCVDCHNAVRQALASGSPVKRFLKASLFGFLASILGAVIYVGVAMLLKVEVGLIAIVVGLIVGLAVRKGSEGRGGWPYQALAMFLTYAAIIMLYVPAAMERQFDRMKHEKAVAAEKAKEGSSALTPSPEGTGAAEEPKPLPKNPILWGIILIVVFAISCVEPFRQGAGNIIGLVLIAIALYEAWKLNKSVNLDFQGPFQIGAAAPEKPAGG